MFSCAITEQSQITDTDSDGEQEEPYRVQEDNVDMSYDVAHVKQTVTSEEFSNLFNEIEDAVNAYPIDLTAFENRLYHQNDPDPMLHESNNDNLMVEEENGEPPSKRSRNINDHDCVQMSDEVVEEKIFHDLMHCRYNKTVVKALK